MSLVLGGMVVVSLAVPVDGDVSESDAAVEVAADAVAFPELLDICEVDPETAADALRMLKKMTEASKSQSTVLMITHDWELASQFCDFKLSLAKVHGQPRGELISFEPFARSSNTDGRDQ